MHGEAKVCRIGLEGYNRLIISVVTADPPFETEARYFANAKQ
jgi:hypothetical protein